MKISHKIPLMATSIILLAFSVFASYQFVQVKKSLYKQIDSDITETSNILDSNISLWMNERLTAVQSISQVLSHNFQVDEFRRVISTQSLNTLVTEYYGALDSDGMFMDNLSVTTPTNADARKRPWYKLAQQHNKPVMTEPYADAKDNRMLITAATKLYDRATVVGAIGADIELKEVSDTVNAINFNKKGYVFLVDEAGKIITHPESDKNGKNIKDLFSGVQPKIDPILQESQIGKEKVLTAFYALQGFDATEKSWFIGIVLEKDKVLEPAYRVGKQAIMTAVLTALFVSLILYLFMRSVLINPVNTLSAQADEISRGNLDIKLEGVNRKDEIGDLAQALQRMQKAVTFAMKKLSNNRK